MRSFASLLMKTVKEHMIITRNVSQLLFDGFDDELLYIARKLNITSIPYDKFGWFYGVSKYFFSSSFYFQENNKI